MPDIARRDAVRLVQSRLEREQAQHMVDGAADLVHAPGTPGPDRRTDELDRLDAAGLEPRLESEIEVGRIDADEGVGWIAQQSLGELVADARDPAVVAQHLGVAAHGELVARPPGSKPMRRHLRRRRPPSSSPASRSPEASPATIARRNDAVAVVKPD